MYWFLSELKGKIEKMKELIRRLESGKLLLEVNKKIYNMKAITQTSYKFTDKCYIHIKPVSEDVVGIYFESKKSSISLEDIANQFCNELIDQQVRIDTEEAYGNIRDAIVKQAFSPIEPKDK